MLDDHTVTSTEETYLDPDHPHRLWWAALAYAGVVGFGWLVMAISRILSWRFYTSQGDLATAAGNLPLANEIYGRAGSFLVDAGYALAAVVVFAFVAIMVWRRSWHAWDYATVAIGGATVLSSIFICASNRIMFALPFLFAPLWGLLYTKGVKASCGVRLTPPAMSSTAEATPAPITTQADLERELTRERHLVDQLRQNLDVFEVERGMDTDTFVDRYVNGLEEETPDNAEWFSIARAVRRSQERIAELQVQAGDAGRGMRE